MSGYENEQPQQPLGLRARIFQNIEMARRGYEQLVHAIIRPPRAEYSLEQLGPSEFTFLGQRFHREDVELDTGRENKSVHVEDGAPLKLQASLWTRQPKDGEDEDTAYPHKTFIVYLHGNASARVEVLPQLSFLLASGIYGVCSLDFCGSGHSDGDYVSLGYYERYDLTVVMDFLQQLYGDALEVVLWGRSMGASTALMHASQQTRDSLNQDGLANAKPTPQQQTDPTMSLLDLMDSPPKSPLKGLICDSPFASLPQLCEELVEKARAQGIMVPGVVVSVAIALIARSVRNMAHFNIHDISPMQHAPTIDTPALFVVGADDDFIPPRHAEDICSVYQKGVSTNLLMVPGGHNDARPSLVFEAIGQFLEYRLTHLNGELALDVPDHIKGRLHQMPPWVYVSQPQVFTAHKISANSKIRVSATSAEVQAQTLGMTQERQDDIQNKLHNMFGQGQPKSQQEQRPTQPAADLQSPSRRMDREEVVSMGVSVVPEQAEEQIVSMGVPVVAAGIPVTFDDFDQWAD